MARGRFTARVAASGGLTNTLPGRLELPTLRLTASRSNQLSYGSHSAWAVGAEHCLQCCFRGSRPPSAYCVGSRVRLPARIGFDSPARTSVRIFGREYCASRLVGWLFGCSVAWLLGCSIVWLRVGAVVRLRGCADAPSRGRLVAWQRVCLLVRSLARLLGWSGACLLAWLVGRLLGWRVVWLVVWLVGALVVRLSGRLVGQSVY